MLRPVPFAVLTAARACRPAAFPVMTLPVLLLALLLAAAPALGADLSADQQKKLDQAETALRQVQSNLKLAQSSAGRGTAKPKGSKAKLAAIRLDSAKQGVPKVQAALEGLPADHADVKPVAEAFAQVQADIAALEARLNGGQAPPPPVADGVKLNYQEVDLLKNADFNLREVEGNAAALTEMLEKLRPVEDPLTINHRYVQSGINTIANAQRKAGFAKDALEQLPADGTGVPEVTQRLVNANAKVAVAAEFLVPLHKKLSALVNIANYPQYPADVKRLGELGGMYRDPAILQTNRTRAAEVLAQGPAAQAEVVRIARAYARLMQQETEEGKRIEGAGNNFLSKYRAFLAAADEEKKNLPEQVRTDMAEVDRLATEAVEKQRPMYFTGGIPQVLGFAEDKLALYKALDPENAPALQAELDELRASLKQREKSLESLIIKQNPLPPDRYTGDDRAKIIEIAIDAWKHQQPEFTVLASRIPSEAWNRETMWRFRDGTAHLVDISRLQVQLIVADENDPTLAIIRPINMIMNHQKADTVIGTPMYAGDDELQPSAYMLRDKVK